MDMGSTNQTRLGKHGPSRWSSESPKAKKGIIPNQKYQIESRDYITFGTLSVDIALVEYLRFFFDISFLFRRCVLQISNTRRLHHSGGGNNFTSLKNKFPKAFSRKMGKKLRKKLKSRQRWRRKKHGRDSLF